MGGLLRKQGDISAQRPMPSTVLNDSNLVTSVTGETVQLYYYNSGVLTSDAGQAAGTLVIGKLAYGPVLDDVGSKVANKDNKSLSFTCLALTNEKILDWTKLEQSFDTTGTILLQTICEDFSNGDYVIDYQTGTVYAKKATTASTMTSTAYKIPGKAPVSVTLEASDIEIGAVEIKSASTDDRAVVNTAGADAVSNTQNQLEVGSRLSAFNGTTWDRLRSGLVAVQTTFVGILNTIGMGRYNATPPTLADGNVAPLQMDASGQLKTTVVPSTYATDDSAMPSTPVTVPVSGEYRASATTYADGDATVLQTDVNGSLKVKESGGATIGPGNPTIDSYGSVAINLTTGADQVLVASAPNKQIWVYGYTMVVGSADGQTVSLQDEDNTAVTGIMVFARYGGVTRSPSGNFAMPIHKLATDKDLEIDITGGDVDGDLQYAIVSV